MTVHQHIRVGQVWRSNDPRNLRAVRVTSVYNESPGDGPGGDYAEVENVVTKKQTRIRLDQFTTGARGWSLDKEKS